MRSTAVAITFAILTISGLCVAGTVDPVPQVLDPAEAIELEANRMIVQSYRMEPLARWQVRFFSFEDDGRLNCQAKVNGKVVDIVKDERDQCILKGVTGKKTEVVTVNIANVGAKTVHLGYDID
jgi:hypothetical protein